MMTGTMMGNELEEIVLCIGIGRGHTGKYTHTHTAGKDLCL